MSKPELTPKQQALMDFLNRSADAHGGSQIATTPMTPEKLAEGNRLLDAAADEYRQQPQEIQTPGEQVNG